jgi:hypothetical protein
VAYEVRSALHGNRGVGGWQVKIKPGGAITVFLYWSEVKIDGQAVKPGHSSNDESVPGGAEPEESLSCSAQNV